MADYREWYVSTLMPAWLSGDMGRSMALALGQIKDLAKDAAKEAVKARMPLLAPADALPAIGADRSLERGAQSESAFRLYLSQSFDLWAAGGTKTGIEDAVDVLGYCTADVYDAHTIDLGPGDTPASAWARFIIVLSGHPWQPDGVWDDPGTWDDGGTWDSTAPAEAVDAIIRAVRRWKGAHAQCLGVVVLFDDAELWDVPIGGTWDDPGTWAEDEDAAIWGV